MCVGVFTLKIRSTLSKSDTEIKGDMVSHASTVWSAQRDHNEKILRNCLTAKAATVGCLRNKQPVSEASI